MLHQLGKPIKYQGFTKFERHIKKLHSFVKDTQIKQWNEQSDLNISGIQREVQYLKLV